MKAFAGIELAVGILLSVSRNSAFWGVKRWEKTFLRAPSPGKMDGVGLEAAAVGPRQEAQRWCWELGRLHSSQHHLLRGNGGDLPLPEAHLSEASEYVKFPHTPPKKNANKIGLFISSNTTFQCTVAYILCLCVLYLRIHRAHHLLVTDEFLVNYLNSESN